MAALTEADIRSLTEVRCSTASVVSCYLDVDGRRYPSHGDYQQGFTTLAKRAERSGTITPSVAGDVARVAAFVRGGFDRHRTRGLAMFSCEAEGLWAVHQLPVRVISQLVVGPSPYVRPLEHLIDDLERIAFVLADRTKARVAVFELGELVDGTEVLQDPSRIDEEDRSALQRRDREHGKADLLHRHVEHVAAAAFDAHKRNPVRRIVLGGPPEVTTALEKALHPYLRARVADRVNLPVSLADEPLRREAMAIEERLERRFEETLVAELRDQAGAGRRAVTGLAATLRALDEHRVERLLVSDRWSTEGWRCPSCRHLDVRGRRCSLCGAEMLLVSDVVEDAVEEALAQAAAVEVCVNADLDCLGGVGAFLRF